MGRSSAMSTDTKCAMRTPLTVLLLIFGVASGCVRHTTSTEAAATPQGPPVIQLDIVRQHAIQFDVDIPDRPPGSQHELAAASYILGHLQLAGYSPRLDRVPVENTVNSTNVVAMPPGGDKPAFLITVAYDTDGSARQHGNEIGLFLEIARALTVADPDHQVGFVALGAESAFGRGTRRLAQFLIDEGVDPSVITIRNLTANPDGVYTSGSCAVSSGAAVGLGDDLGTCRGPILGGDVFTSAEIEHTLIEGDFRSVGQVLFDFLSGTES